MISVIATITTKAGMRDQFLAEFKKLVPDVLAEQGCIEYMPATDVATGIPQQPALRNDCLMVIEKWDSVEALRAHLVAPHMDAFRERTQNLVEGLEILVVQPQVH